MKNYFLFLFACLLSVGLIAQAPLPTSFDFDSPNPPLGWTLSLQNGNTTYSGGSDGNPSCRLDETGDHVIIEFAESPGLLSFHIKGSTFQGAPWEGNFKVEESVDGTAWTDVRVFETASNAPSGSFTPYSNTLGAASRFLRFYYVEKISGSNIALDEISVQVVGPGPEQEINAMFQGDKVLSGDNVTFGTPVADNLDLLFQIENLGTQMVLHLNSISFSGPQMSEFSIVGVPADSVSPSSSTPLMVRFNPQAAGTRSAVLSIGNDDSDENPYIINLFGVGGSSASEPTAQPTAFVSTDIRSFMFHSSFTEANPAPDGGYIILRNDFGQVADVPQDGQTYVRGDIIGSSKVISSGFSTSFSPNNIVAGKSYHFAVFSYNGGGFFTNYLESNPLQGTVVSAVKSMRDPNYYDTLDVAAPTFVQDLTTKIQPHFQVYYQNYTSTMLPFSSRDTSGENSVVTCQYSGENKVYSNPFNWTSDGYSREHTFSSSWMPSGAGSDTPPYSDQHNLFPTNLTEVNIPRSNNPFGEVVNITSPYLEGTLGTDMLGNTVYEPRENKKGDVARAIFYMTVAYDGWEGTSWSWVSLSGKKIQAQNQQLLKDWHWQDPPDAWEIARNDYLDTLQKNRNPFVDHPEYVCFVDFWDLSLLQNSASHCQTIGTEKEELVSALNVFPNPVKNKLTIVSPLTSFGSSDFSIYNLLGEKVNIEAGFEKQNSNTMILEVGELIRGMYILDFVHEGKRESFKFIKE